MIKSKRRINKRELVEGSRTDRAIQAREKLRRMYAERAAAVGMSLTGYCARFGVKL